jgi:hypothetical protein
MKARMLNGITDFRRTTASQRREFGGILMMTA